MNVWVCVFSLENMGHVEDERDVLVGIWVILSFSNFIFLEKRLLSALSCSKEINATHMYTPWLVKLHRQSLDSAHLRPD